MWRIGRPDGVRLLWRRVAGLAKEGTTPCSNLGIKCKVEHTSVRPAPSRKINISNTISIIDPSHGFGTFRSRSLGGFVCAAVCLSAPVQAQPNLARLNRCFAVLGGVSVSNSCFTTLSGIPDVSPGSTTTGFGPEAVLGSIHIKTSLRSPPWPRYSRPMTDWSRYLPNRTAPVRI